MFIKHCNIGKKLDEALVTIIMNQQFIWSKKGWLLRCIWSHGPKRSIKITDHFTCTSANVISCINCTYRKNLYIGETGRRLGDRFRKYLRDAERNDKDASKPVARHFILPNHSKQHMAACGLSLRRSESRKIQEQKFIFKVGTLNPYGVNERFSFN